MNKFNLSKMALVIFFVVITLSSCQAIGDIFKTGVWFGVIGVIVVIAIIFWLINKTKK